jgi:hypothetical protein
MLAARGDPSWTERYEAWWATAAAHFPASASPYGAVLRTAIPLWLAKASSRRPGGIGPELGEIPAFVNPHFVAAREILAEAFISAGDLDQAAALAGQSAESDWTELMRASQALISSWIAGAAGEVEQGRSLGREAANHARSCSAAWWLARALRASGADPDVAELEARLGIVARTPQPE